MPNTPTPLKLYKSRIAAGELNADPVQERAVIALHRLYEDIITEDNAPKQNFFQRMTTGWIAPKDEAKTPKGVYMYGGVGRGKSMLMDLFYECLPQTTKKRRVHFHEFMIEVHDYINTRSADDSVKGIVDQALPSLAELIARNSRVLCFDEFHVVDITDAMILGRLFKILFERDVIVVATSNWAPNDLYKDGLQRDRFTPFIKKLKTKVYEVHLDSPHDYRTMGVQITGTYFTPLNSKTKAKMNEAFSALTHGTKPHKDILNVKGRDIHVESVAKGVARFSFAQLCERAYGAEDYLEIAHKYHTVFLEDIPRLSYDRRNEAKRLMNLIDALYEARVRVIISAMTTPEKLYRGDDHAYEFERTISRLLEMQSEGYP